MKLLLAVIFLVSLNTMAHAAPQKKKVVKRQPASIQKSQTSMALSTSMPRAKTGLLRLKPTVGVTAMKVTSSSGPGLETDAGFSGGALLEFGAGYGSVETGLMINQGGGRLTRDQSDVKYTLTYVSIPLLAKLNFLGNTNNTFYVKSGIVPSYLITSEATSKIDNRVYRTTDLDVNKFDTFAQIGLGGTVKLDDLMPIGLEASYMRGLVNLAKQNGEGYNDGFLFAMTFGINLL